MITQFSKLLKIYDIRQIFKNVNLSEFQYQIESNIIGDMNTKDFFSNLNPELSNEISEICNKIEIPKNTEVMRDGQYIKAIPIVLNGLIKVFTKNEDKEFLLYYIRPNETCIMTFDAALKNSPSKVYASTEEITNVLLLPIENVFKWMKIYPDLNAIFLMQYNLRYNELIHMVNDLLFEKMDQRLLKYLKTKVEIVNKNPIKISHKKIANDLGTAREVISRVMKKLEIEGKVKQLVSGIKII